MISLYNKLEALSYVLLRPTEASGDTPPVPTLLINPFRKETFPALFCQNRR